MSYGFKIIVTGDYACFARPEMKVERALSDKQNSGVQPYRVYQYPTKRGQR